MPAARCRVRAHGKTAGIELPAVFPAGLVRLPRRYFSFRTGAIPFSAYNFGRVGADARPRRFDSCAAGGCVPVAGRDGRPFLAVGCRPSIVSGLGVGVPEMATTAGDCVPVYTIGEWLRIWKRRQSS